MEDDLAPLPSPNTDDEAFFDDDNQDAPSPLSEPASPLHAAPARAVPLDRETRARRLVARLRQPFGALLLTLSATGRRAVDYRRVAADSVITVQSQDGVSLADLLDNVRTFDVL